MASREHDPASSVLEGDSAAAVPPDRVFEAKPVWQRMVIILSGVTLNSIFALLIFTGLAWKNGRRYDPTTTLGHVNAELLPPEAAAVAAVPPGTRITAVDGHKVKAWDDIGEHITASSSNEIIFQFAGRPDLVIPLHRDALAQRAALVQALEPDQPPVIGAVGVSTPASAAGLAIGDSIVSVDGKPIVRWTDAVDLIRPAIGKPLAIVVAHGGEQRTNTVTPKADHENPDDAKSPMIGRIGVGAKNPG
jgi:regulator of sigma E protease